MLDDYPHLKGIKMDEFQTKAVLPTHVILEASDLTKIKIKEAPRIGKIGDPIAELTKLEWIIISPGEESTYSKLLLKISAFKNYEELCSLDVLAISEKEDINNESVLNKSQKSTIRKGGYCETWLIWKEGNYKLEDNKAGSLGRLNNLLKNHKQESNKLKEYDDIIKSQLQEGFVEIAPEIADENKEFYLPHKPVYPEDAETTKVRSVFDPSAKATKGSSSLNGCLETGPTLQNLLWDILVRNRFKPTCLCADI